MKTIKIKKEESLFDVTSVENAIDTALLNGLPIESEPPLGTEMIIPEQSVNVLISNPNQSQKDVFATIKQDIILNLNQTIINNNNGQEEVDWQTLADTISQDFPFTL